MPRSISPKRLRCCGELGRRPRGSVCLRWLSDASKRKKPPRKQSRNLGRFPHCCSSLRKNKEESRSNLFSTWKRDCSPRVRVLGQACVCSASGPWTRALFTHTAAIKSRLFSSVCEDSLFMEQHLVNMALMRDQAFLPYSAELILMKTLIMSDNYSDVAGKKRKQGSHCPEWKKKLQWKSFLWARRRSAKSIWTVQCTNTLWRHLHSFIIVFTRWIISLIIEPAHKSVYDPGDIIAWAEVCVCGAPSCDLWTPWLHSWPHSWVVKRFRG